MSIPLLTNGDRGTLRFLEKDGETGKQPIASRSGKVIIYRVLLGSRTREPGHSARGRSQTSVIPAPSVARTGSEFGSKPSRQKIFTPK